MNNRVFFYKKDLMIIFIILITSILIYAFYFIHNKGNDTYLEVICNGNVEAQINFDGKTTTYIPKSCPNVTVEIDGKKARVKDSDCPDKICVNTGWIALPGQSAVCLPNRFSIVIKSKKQNEVDVAI